MRKKRKIKKLPSTEHKIVMRKKRRPIINIGKLISEYLIHSYLYYEEQKPVVSDNEFDKIVNTLLENFEKVEKSWHPHKNLVEKTYCGYMSTRVRG